MKAAAFPAGIPPVSVALCCNALIVAERVRRFPPCHHANPPVRLPQPVRPPHSPRGPLTQ